MVTVFVARRQSLRRQSAGPAYWPRARPVGDSSAGLGAQSSNVTLNLRPLIRPALRLCCALRLTLLLTATYEK